MPDGEVGRRADEVRHRVTISKPFYMGETEISQKQFMSLMRPNFKPVFFNNGPWGHSLSEIHQGGPWKAKSRYHRDPSDNPMENVTWKQAMAFCKLLTDIEQKAGRLPAGYEYRLPTEAEWEYACRAGTTGSFNHPEVAKRAEQGHAMGDSVFRNNYPNAFGLFRMHMGVFEWCLDDFAPYQAGSKTDPVTLKKGQGARKVARGGDDGYAIHPSSRNKKLTDPKDIYRYIRSASRCNFPAGIPLPIVGFRPVLAPKIGVPEPTVPEEVSIEPLPKEQAQP